jgi:hypothetical protein
MHLVDDAVTTATDAAVGKGFLSINAQTGTTYTLVLTDVGKAITMTNGSASTLTIPLNATAAIPVGTSIPVIQLGAGQVTVVIVATGTVNGYPGVKLSGQYAVASLLKIATNTWIVTGQVAA